MSASDPEIVWLSLEGCYQALSGGGRAQAAAERLLARRHWIHETGEFDERTGELLPGALGHLCARIRSSSASAPVDSVQDRLFRILKHVHKPLEEILRRLHEGLVRRHASLPLRAVRELDTTSFFALSRRSGRTVREKLADRPYLWAVERRWTVDTAENRLVKAFCVRVTELLRTRTTCRRGREAAWLEDLHATMESWLRTPEAREIGRWENLPPNNLLLQHRDYRRVWDAWSWTLSIDDDLRRDHGQRLAQWTTMAFWSLVARLEDRPDVRLLEQPCYLDYERFAIEPAHGRDRGAARVDGVIVGAVANPDRRPRAFAVEMDPRGRITVRPPLGPAVVIVCAHAGERITVRVGAKVIAADPSPSSAIELAIQAMVALSVAPSPGPRVAAAAAAVVRVPSDAGMAVVDLCALHPRFATADRYGTLPFRLLWQRWQPAGRSPTELDVGVARAISLGPDLASVTILDLFAPEPPHPPALLGQAARVFATKLREKLKYDALTYLVPDATDEFVLGTLRRAVNAAFPVAEPLPRSIAAVFDWQSSPDFTERAIADGDCVLVLDSVGTTLSATPLRARWRKELRARLPESGGIFWERCPCIQSGPSGTSHATAAAVLAQLDCPYPDEIARIGGLQGLADERNDLSWHHEVGGWFTAPLALEQTIRSAVLALEAPWAQLRRGVAQELADLGRNARVFVLLVGDVFREAHERVSPPPLIDGYPLIPLGFIDEAHRGGAVLYRWQAQAGDLPLWRDRLPELSMRINSDGRRVRFHLVKETTVAPRRGHAVRIPIKDQFVLPRGQADYCFPLLQGSEESELNFEAFLRSPAFPLAEDLPVVLELTYSYGTDTPYDLVFTNAQLGIKVRAEWRPRSDSSTVALEAPSPPVPASWADLERYPSDKGNPTNLLAWLKADVERIQRRLRMLDAQRHVATVSTDWKFDKHQKRFVFADSSLGSVFCHERDFLVKDDVARVGRGTALRMDVEPGPKGLSGQSINLATRDGAAADEGDLIQKMDRIVLAMKRGPRFPFRVVWMDGRTLADPDVPADFLAFMRKATDDLASLLPVRAASTCSAERVDAARQLSEAALYLLCCMHSDAPGIVPNALRSTIASSGVSALAPWRYGRHVALALGACRLDWQRELLGDVLAELAHEAAGLDAWGACLQILGLAVWRCGSLLATLTAANVELLVDRVNRVLAQDLAQLASGQGGLDARPLVDRLELVLALLRTRASEEAAIRVLLTPRQPAARMLARTVQQIMDLVSDHDIQIVSRISLAVLKPQGLHRTPDILYALQLYLTGDDGARAIHVMAVKTDDDTSDPSAD